MGVVVAILDVRQIKRPFIYYFIIIFQPKWLVKIQYIKIAKMEEERRAVIMETINEVELTLKVSVDELNTAIKLVVDIEAPPESANDIDKSKGLGDKPWHLMSEEEILSELGVTLNGLSTAEHAIRLEKYGYNILSLSVFNFNNILNIALTK